jgi:hypothetical protein
MTLNKSALVRIVLVVALCGVVQPVTAATTGQESTSHAVVARLTAFLISHGLDSLAAEDRSRPGVIVAVLHIPKSQLLVIEGRCSAVDALRARLATKAYRDVYSDLQGCATADSRLFIQDLGADGVLFEPREDGAPFDIVYEKMTRQTRFDGNFKAQQLSEQEYRQRFQTIDAEYSRLVSLLLEGVERP